MKNKKFKMLNDVGIEVEYTTLGIISYNGEGNFIIYTNYMPSDNAFGYRILVSKLINEDPLETKRVNLSKQKEIIEYFLTEVLNLSK